MKIYLDNAATTKLDKQALKAILDFYQKNYTNPASIHFSGQKNHLILEKHRARVAKNLGTSPERIVFTSGATEANNYLIRGTMAANSSRGKHLIVSAIEHPSVYNLAETLSQEGYQVDYLPINKKGIVSLEALKKLLKPATVLVSVMAVNNEIGTIMPIDKIAKLVQANGSYFHSDLTQAINYLNININKLGINLASLSAHKFNGPVGIGVAVIDPAIKIKPLIIGGNQENGQRSGTSNLAGIIGLSTALALAVKNREKNKKKVKGLRDYFWQELKKEIKDIELNGCLRRRLPNNLNILFEQVEGEAVLIDLSDKGVEVSTGSACSALNLKTSYVLSALGLPAEKLNSNIRFSLSKDNTKAEIDYTIKHLKKIIKRLRYFSPIK